MMLNGQSLQHGTSAASTTTRRKKIPAQTAITDFMGSLNCVVCGCEERVKSNHHRRATVGGPGAGVVVGGGGDGMIPPSSSTSFVCSTCTADPAAVLSTLHARLDTVDEKASQLQDQCRTCAGSLYPILSATTMFDLDSTSELQCYEPSRSSARSSSEDMRSSESKRFAGRGLMSVDGCVALDCPVQFSRCQYLSRCEDARVSLAHFTTTLTASKASTSANNRTRCSASTTITSSTSSNTMDLSW